MTAENKLYTKEFVWFLGRALLTFMGLAIITVLLHMAGSGLSFVASWRWLHDTLLIPIFWYIAPLLLVVFLLDIVLEKYKLTRWLHTVPVAFHEVVVVFFALASISVISQVFGGCIWFVPTEMWWDRFVPPPFSETQMVIFYVIASILGVITTYEYWKRFVLTEGQK